MIFFLSIQGIYTKKDHILGHRTNIKKSEIPKSNTVCFLSPKIQTVNQ